MPAIVTSDVSPNPRISDNAAQASGSSPAARARSRHDTATVYASCLSSADAAAAIRSVLMR